METFIYSDLQLEISPDYIKQIRPGIKRKLLQIVSQTPSSINLFSLLPWGEILARKND